MRPPTFRPSWLVTTVAVAVLTTGSCIQMNAQETASPQTGVQADSEGEVETLLRGPLHEAFAEPIQDDPTPGEVISKAPPEAIDEVAPEVKPSEDHVIWISGYWAFDEERDDYLWVSGVWRVPPPGQRWVPGYWTESEGGYQWIAGFWSSAESEEIVYLPNPPASVEQGPSSPAPSENHYWVSGCWEYQDSSYAWRPGYWGEYHEGWVWLPGHYNWTPRGAVYVGGYWDYTLNRRGQIFAPVYFHNHRQRAGYRYSPNVAIDLGPLLVHLFVQPRHNHYYWGDYYGDRYQRSGYHAWANHQGRQGRDPLFSYYQTHYRTRGIDYQERMHGWNRYYERHEDHRPARTFEAQTKLAANIKTDGNLKYSLLGRTMSDLIADDGKGQRFRRLEDNERRSFADTNNDLRGLIKQRVKMEANASVRGDATLPKAEAGKPVQPRGKFKLPELKTGNLPKAETPQPPAIDPRERGTRSADRGDDTPRRGTPRETLKPIVPDRKLEKPIESPNVPRNLPKVNPRKQIPILPEQPDRSLDVPKKPKSERPDRSPRVRGNRPGNTPGKNVPTQRPGKKPEQADRNPVIPKRDRKAEQEIPRKSRREIPRRGTEKPPTPKVDKPRTPQPKFEKPQTPRRPKIETPPQTPDLPNPSKFKGPKGPKS